MRDVYEAAFPRIERRPFDNLLKAARERENACAEGILYDGELVGFIFFWRLSTNAEGGSAKSERTSTRIDHFEVEPSSVSPSSAFLFGEYIVIAPPWQGRRIGETVVRMLLAREKAPLVFETEPPETEIAHRRIAFHERLGGRLWDAAYMQPTYHPDLPWTPMHLFVNGDLADEYRDAVREIIHREVYNVTPDYERKLQVSYPSLRKVSKSSLALEPTVVSMSPTMAASTPQARAASMRSA